MEKNRLEKVRKHVFYKHMNSVKKMGEKRGKKFFQKHTASKANNDGKKSSRKSAKTRFFINTRIS